MFGMEFYRALLCVLLLYTYQVMPTLSYGISGRDLHNTHKSSTTVDLKVVHSAASPSSSPFGQDHTVIQFEYHNKSYILDLTLNRQLEAENAVLRYKQNGTYIKEQVKPSEQDRCLFTGSVRGADDSAVAVSTCDGVISGVVWEPGRTLLLRPAADGGGRHLLQVTNGAPGRHRAPRAATRRRRREAPPAALQGPIRAGPDSLYLELALVLDSRVYQESGHDLRTAHRRAKQIANILHSIYARLDIFVALVGVDVWTEGDEITLSENANDTLTNFLYYRRERLADEMPNDNAQLITGTRFDGGIVGNAVTGVMCTDKRSGGVSTDHSSQVSLVAATVAHELGHNLGLEHDTGSCQCPDERCVMHASASSVGPTQWSSCSKEQLKRSLKHGLGHCLHDRPPAPLFSPPTCGNGFVEAGEECDCGLPSDCSTPCCDPATCRLSKNGTCASGACCDLQTCRPRSAGATCRPVSGECDLAEYCNGTSALCPADVHRLDGLTCSAGQSHCHGGRCATRDDQCRRLWGHSGSSSVPQCYHQNSEGNVRGDCGYDWQSRSYTPCQYSDTMCGRLHCAHLNERLEYGVESSAILSASFLKLDGEVMPCRSAIVDLGRRQRDPGLVPQGASCGADKMCVDQRCVPVEAVMAGACPGGCGGHGVCNSRGNCHCDYGWAPPNCTESGVGGSVDSGPHLQTEGNRTAAVVLFVIFLGVVPLVAAVLCCLYCERHGLTPGQFIRRPAGCRLPACTCPKLPACMCPTLPSFTTLRRKLPSGGGSSSATPRPAAAARSVRRPDVPRDQSSKTASYNVRLLVLSGENELLQPAGTGAASSTSTASSTTASSTTAVTTPGRGLASNLLGRLTSLARSPASEGADSASDRLVCEVKPTAQSSEKKAPSATTSPSRKPTGAGVPKVVADKLLAPRTTFGILNRQSSGPTSDQTSAADSRRRTTFGMAPLSKDSASGAAAARSAFLAAEADKPSMPSGPPPARGPVTGQVRFAASTLEKKSATNTLDRKQTANTLDKKQAVNAADKKQTVNAADKKQTANNLDTKAAAKELEKKSTTNTLDKKQAVNAADKKQASNTLNKKVITNTLEKNPTTNMVEKKLTVSSPERPAEGTVDRKYANVPDTAVKTPTDSAMDRKYANVPELTPTPAAEAKQPAATGPGRQRSGVGDGRPSQPTAAPLVQRSDSVPAGPEQRQPAAAATQVRFAPDTLERRPAVARSDSAPAGGQSGSRSSTLESDRGSTGERDAGGGGSRGSTLSRVASVFRRGDKPSEPPAAASEGGLRASQSFKAAKLDRDTIRNLGISNPIPQPPGQFSTLPTSPRGRRGQPAAAAAPARASSDVGGRPLRPVSLLVRPSEPPPRPPNVTELYDDCNVDWSSGRGGATPTENIYCTIDEAPDQRPARPTSMVEPGVLADADRLYQNTMDRRAPWRSAAGRQPTVGRAESAAARMTKAWSPIAEERSPSVPSLAEPAVVSSSVKAAADPTPTAAQPRLSVPWAAKFSAAVPVVPVSSAVRPVAAVGGAGKPTAAVAPARAAEPARQMPEYAKPTPRSGAGAKPTAAVVATSRQPAGSAASSGPAAGVSGQSEGRAAAAPSASSASPAGRQTGPAAATSSGSPGSVRSVTSTASSTKSSAASASAGKKSTSAASSSKQPTSAQSIKQSAAATQSAKQATVASAQSSKKAATSSSSRPGSLSAASSQQSMTSVTSTRSNVSSPPSDRADGAPGRKAAAGRKAGSAAATKKTGAGKTETAAAAGPAGKKTGSAVGKKTSTAGGTAGGRVTSPTSDPADKAATKAGSAVSKVGSTAGKAVSASAKKEPASTAARVGPAPTKASAARAAAAAAKVGATSKVSAGSGKSSASARSGGPATKATSKA